VWPFRYYFKSRSASIDALEALAEHQAAEDAAQAELAVWRSAQERDAQQQRQQQQQWQQQQQHEEEKKAAVAALAEDAEGYGWYGGGV
jgi:hypothetical protein